jgi:large subunit ribosomal protein L4
MKCDVVSLENKKVGSIELDDSIFGMPMRSDLIARAVNWQLAKRRTGSHKTKQRSEVRGTSAKMNKPRRCVAVALLLVPLLEAMPLSFPRKFAV